MNVCPSWRDRLLDYALDALDATEAEAVEKHVEACSGCARALPEFRARRREMEAGLEELTRGAAPSPGFRARTLARIEAGPAPPLWRLAWAGAPVAMVLIALLAAFWLYRSGRGPVEIRREDWVAARELVEWRSPTESLMRSSLDNLLQSAPRFAQFYLDLSPNLSGGNR